MTRAHDDLDFISSICSNFADALYRMAGTGEFSGQDAYEVLAAVFGDDFSEGELRGATTQHHQALAEATVDELELDSATAQAAKEALEYALASWSEDEL